MALRGNFDILKYMKTKIKKSLIFAIIFIVAVFMAAALFLTYPEFFISRKKIGNVIYFPNQNLKIKVELATAPYQWVKGLMFREFLSKDSGMLFVFPDERIRSFWMKNTKIPLDIIFISKDSPERKIVDIKANFEPCPETKLMCPSYNSAAPSMYVLETNAGFAKKNDIKIGDSVEINRN